MAIINCICQYDIKCNLKRSTKQSCGYDFVIDGVDEVIFPAEQWCDVETNVCILGKTVKDMPSWSRWFMLVAPRSSLGMKYGMRFANTVGIIDQDYNGTIKARVWVDKELHLYKGDKLMQGIVIPYCAFSDEEEPTEIRDGGIGSTNKV